MKILKNLWTCLYCFGVVCLVSTIVITAHAQSLPAIDTNTAWGQWYTSEYVPYREKIDQALMKTMPSQDTMSMGGDPLQIIKSVNEGYKKAYEDMLTITPPVGLEKYHDVVVQMYKETAENDPKNMRQAMQFSDRVEELEAQSKAALTEGLSSNHLPQDLIDEIITSDYDY